MSTAAWVPCDFCECFWCRIHQLHVWECDCPSLEEWIEDGVDPYSEGGPEPVTGEAYSYPEGDEPDEQWEWAERRQ